jgi:phage terminase small subunit
VWAPSLRERRPGSIQIPRRGPAVTTRPRFRPPAHLKPATKRWVTGVVDSFELEAHHFRLLTLAAEAWDRCQDARESLARHGTVFTDRFGQPRARPEVAIERDARIAFARMVRELALDVQAPDSRPPGIE